jgi:NADPH:quinone reductase-like Zn-dependent oxidoreductase
MAEGGTMQALVMPGFGDPDRLRVEEVVRPPCREGDVLVRVAAAGVNPVDWKECAGHLEPFYGKYAERWVPGYDAAGVVEAVGAKVTAFAPGDRVVVFSDRRENGHNGTFAEYVRVLANAVAKVPASVALTEAAAIPTAGLTGYQALLAGNKAGLEPGDAVLIHGAAGGVGSYTVQFATAKGLKVAATCSARNLDYVKTLGADLVIDYAKGPVAPAVRAWAPDGVHAIIDCVSGDTLPDAFEALRPGGKLISIATLTQDGDIAGDTERAARRGFAKIFSIMNFDRIDAELGEILDLMAAGQVKTPPLAAYPLAEGAKALEKMRAGGVRGKIVITM